MTRLLLHPEGSPDGGGAAVVEAPVPVVATPAPSSNDADAVALYEPEPRQDTQVTAEKPAEAEKPVADVPNTGDSQKPDAPADDKNSGWTKELLSRAKDDGISDEDARSFPGGPQALEKALSIVEKRFASEAQAAQAAQAAPVQTPKPEAVGKPAQPPVQPAEGDPALLLPKLDPADYGDALVKGWEDARGLISSQHKALTEQKAYVEHLTNVVHDLRQAAWYDKFDSALAGLGKEAEEVLGKGRMEDLEDGSEPVKNRSELHDMTLALMERYRLAGRNVPLREVVKRAYQGIFAKEAKQAVINEINEKNKRFGKGSAPPAIPRTPGENKNTGSREQALSKVLSEEEMAEYRRDMAERENSGFFLPE